MKKERNMSVIHEKDKRAGLQMKYEKEEYHNVIKMMEKRDIMSAQKQISEQRQSD